LGTSKHTLYVIAYGVEAQAKTGGDGFWGQAFKE